MQAIREITKCERSIRSFTPTAPAIHLVDDFTFETDFEEIEDNGFIDLFWSDCSHGFKVFCDEEITHILNYKAKNHVYDSNKDYRPTVKLFFYQSIPALNVEVDLNNPHHEKLMNELTDLPSEGSKRVNALKRISSVAKKMGMKANLGATGTAALATDLYMVWRDENGLISG